ncbi:MAG TPA: glutamyl-tRNA reductase [Ruminiclostridium sp.]|uniref:Glutamyl-tRNA reductase n=1 Tax=Acetivibrio saccincola TaxID=1677857 RepID=A0A2S8R9V8_9FIRM|nr:glutamyl-tRNA reductase [Acetivibrio saccincola]HAA43318.1 glutamyl-tRNA reductase [Ruminiclostridium sp.]NLW27008.1 glutamyl-tRNA reductase [Acetivibrio saccincola]PQQ66570.1 glutamyl-tRNA reductase [Acetivibrio saccincola]HOA97961.1 glutamyl-tRNA reductase [Acetivibrio saccincola]HQD29241.1 glutamyl-tRNA reductase [Acetivibrio saccincola]
MGIIMAGIDYRTAEIGYREKFSFTKSKVREIIKDINKNFHIDVVLLCTCNRTEIYIYSNKKENTIDPVGILCKYAGVDAREYKKFFFMKEGKEAVKHLMEVACGLHSMIFGEDQIISQVRNSIEISREENVSGSVLNTLFRYAITSAKEVKSSVYLRSVCPSVAKKAVELLQDDIKKSPSFKVLVIGTGEVGRSVCSLLNQSGCEVYVTLRTRKPGNATVPDGCIPVNYNLRQEYFNKVNGIISATSSPHYTITYQMLKECKALPDYIIDLAVPRDVEPAVSTIEGIKHYNIDTIGSCGLKDNSTEIEIVDAIVEKQMKKFYEWFAMHRYSRDIASVKNLTIKKVKENLQKHLTEEQKIEKAISKTIDYIMYSIKDDIKEEMFLKIKEGIMSKR